MTEEGNTERRDGTDLILKDEYETRREERYGFTL